MTDRAVIVGAFALVALAVLTMGLLHEKHYKERRYRLLAVRVNELENILTEERDS